MGNKELRIGRPNGKQRQFFMARARHVAYGGARGGGKSWAVRQKACMMACYYAGIKLLIIRRTYAELRNNHVIPLQKQLSGIARYLKAENAFLFGNGSRLEMGYCDCDGDLMRYQGGEWDVIFLEEATQFKEEWIKELIVCCRGVNRYPKRVYYTMNPGGPGHGYIKRLFVDRKFNTGEHPEDYVFIQALVDDNTALMESQPEYVRLLDSLPAKLREAWRYGRWDVFEGMFFEDFRDDPAHYGDGIGSHVIATPRSIPRHWRIYASFDWGYSKPFSANWYGVDYDGTVTMILEWYGCTGEPDVGIKWPPAKVFAHMREIEEEHPFLKGREITRVADPAIWDAEHGESIAQTAAKYGIYFSPADHARVAGWMQCHYRLMFDEEGRARFYVFDQCRNFIRTVPLMEFDRHRAEDLDTGLEDHACDSWRYCMMEMPVAPIKEAEGSGYDPHNDPLDMMVRRNKGALRSPP